MRSPLAAHCLVLSGIGVPQAGQMGTLDCLSLFGMTCMGCWGMVPLSYRRVDWGMR